MAKPPDTVSVSDLTNDKSITATEYRRLKAAQRMMNRLAGGMTDKALNWIENEIDNNGDNAFQAAKLVLEYAMGKPKQAVTVDAKVEHSHTLHLDTLKALTMKQIDDGRVTIDQLPSAKPLNSLDNSEQPTKQDIKLAAETVPDDSAETPPTPRG